MPRRAVVAPAAAALLTAGLVTLSAGAASAGGSDAPTPYEVTATGLVLPAGRTLGDHAHVNVRYTVDGVTRSANLHTGQDGDAQHGFADDGSIAWADLGLRGDFCVTWVQVSGFDEHFGEGGQAAVCRTATPTPTATSTPTSTPAPTPAAPAPAPSPTRTAAPTTPPLAEVLPTPETPTPAPELAAVVLGATPSPTPPPVLVAEVLAAGVSADDLATTGTNVTPFVVAAVVALGGGAALLVARRRGRAAGAHRA